MGKQLIWSRKDRRANFGGRKFDLFRTRYVKEQGGVGSRWVEDEKGSRWGFKHPEDGRIVALKKAPEKYGRVITVPDVVEDLPLLEPATNDLVLPEVILGKPTLGVIDHEQNKDV